jgi:GAF domain-containing protein
MSDLAAKVRSILGRELTRAEAARQVTDAIHAGGFRWVGVYEVTPTEVVNLSWSGPAGPAHPTFPIDQGLTAEAVATGRSVVCNDVAADPRYLTALESTGSEIIVPVVTAGRVAGTLDVESERLDAFDDEVRLSLERVAAELPPLYDLPDRRLDG